MIESVLTDAQRDLFERTKADELLVNVATFNMLRGVIASDVERAIGLLQERNGKIGACIIIEPPIASPTPNEVVGGLLNTEFSFLVLEDPTINDSADGTQIDALTICRRLVAIHQYYAAAGLLGCLVLKEPGINPVNVPGVTAPVQYRVMFAAMESRVDWWTKVSTPKITPKNGAAPQTVSLSSTTTGAAIYYTLDGTHPWSGNASALLYSAPFEVSAAATVRAGAFKSGMIASDVNAADFD